MKNPLHTIKKIFTKSAKPFRGILRSKYIEIILAVGLFILLDTGVLVINFYTSYQISDDAHAIQLASRMGTLSQSLLHELYQVREDAGNPEVDYFDTIDIFAKSYKLFDETIDAFIYGGELIGEGQGQDALLKDTTYKDTSAHFLKDAEEIWKEYRVKLKPIVYAYFDDAERGDVIQASETAIAYARQNSNRLLELMQSFAHAVEGVAQRKAERLRTIQSVGITLAVINFFLILFHFLKRLSRSDALVEKSRKETVNILENVEEGLFLLDRNYIIGSQHSKSLDSFFMEKNLGGRNFLDLLRPLVTKKILDTVEEYTEILFSPRVNETLITELNPLNQVEINQSLDSGSFDTRYFSFQFSRVYENMDFNSLLVTVKDITEQVELAELLKAANEKVGKEIDMLLAIIHVDNIMLTDFLKTTENGLNRVNNILKEPAKTREKLQRKLEIISRITHKLKGDSTVLGLEFIVDKFHNLENLIAVIREKQSLTGEDFLPLVVLLDQLISDFRIIRNLQLKMNEIDNSMIKPSLISTANVTNSKSTAGIATSASWKIQMSNLVTQVAKDFKKQVVLNMSDFDSTLLSNQQFEPVKDIIVQSLRNAVAHGLETPVSRESAGKSREGNVKVALSKNSSGLQLTIRDDGNGLDLEKIKSKAVSMGITTQSQIEEWQKGKLLSLIFMQGFTTSQNSGIHAGQGVGMDLIKSQLDALKGQVKVRFKQGHFTEFRYHFQPGHTVSQ